MKNEECLCKYFVFFSVVSAIEAEQLLKVSEIPKGLVIVSLLLRESTVGTLDAIDFREVRDLIPFHVFLISF